MKKTIRTVGIFVLILAVLLAVALLSERLGGSRARTAAVEEKTAANEMDERGATVIALRGEAASVTGRGAVADGSVVTIRYPGTYRVEGTLDDGQLVVDLGDYDGAAYLILNGAQIRCSTGPALLIEQADDTVVYLPAGTNSSLSDGTDYWLEEAGAYDSGAALFSRDDLTITGEGALEVIGNAADGVRSKDDLVIESGSLYVTSADDGLQAAESLSVRGGTLLVGTGGDGVKCTQGAVDIAEGEITISSVGDAVEAFTDLTVSGGSLSVATFSGSTMFEAIAAYDWSAKGLKADTISITGGSFFLDTADDAIHADRDITITGGAFTLSSGDDAIHAAGTLTVRDVALTIPTSYEGLEGDTIRLTNVWISIAAGNNGIDAGEGGLTLEDGTVFLTAPRGLGSDGLLSVTRGYIRLTADGTDSLLSVGETVLERSTILAYSTAGYAETLLEKGELPGSLLFVLDSDVPAGTAVTLTNAAGEVCGEATTTTTDGGALLYAGWWLVPGETYTLTAGEHTYEAEVGAGCAVVQPVIAQNPSGEMGGMPGGFPGRR